MAKYSFEFNAGPAAGELLPQVMLLQQQGRLREAEVLCRQILQAQPENPGALQSLGMIALQTGHAEAAVELIGKSLAADANQFSAHANLAVALLGLRRFEAALASCDQALRLAPDHAPAHYNRGTALSGLKRFTEALTSFDRALQLKPDFVQALNNRGNALARLNRPAEALEAYDRALSLVPNLPDTLNNRGAVLAALNRPAEALDSCARALQLSPNFAEAWNERGRALRLLRRSAEALEACERALQLRPDFVDAWDNRGGVLWDQNRLEESLASFDHALELDPQYHPALANRANPLCKLGRHQEALESCERALRIQPDSAEALHSRGTVLFALQRSADALESFDAALRVRPDFPAALHNRGSALQKLRRLAEALTSFERAIQLGHDGPEPLTNYGWALLHSQRYEAAAECFARVVATDPHFNYALGAMLLARMSCCDWSQYQETVDRILAAVNAGHLVIDPFAFLAASDVPEVNLRCARAYTADRFPSPSIAAFRGKRYEHDRIRVAYVSPDMRDGHVVSLLLAPLIERHDRHRFETIGISTQPPRDAPIGARIRAAFDRFHDVSQLGDEEVAALMCDLEVDIAVDVGGLTGRQRCGIFARRAAPVQVNYLGYPGSMGADYYDYILADATLIPGDYRRYYSEKVVYLPDSYQANHTERPLPGSLTRAECGLPPTGLVFCCFNNTFKFTPGMFDVWMRVLRQVEGSVLWLAAHRPEVADNLRAAAVQRGVAAERVIFGEYTHGLEEYFARYTLADLFLDTLPFNAHATASDALWCGLPVVTCLGNAFAGRVAASLLRTVGLPELVAQTLSDYERIILELARAPGRLADLRARLANNRTTSALFDIERFRGHLESAYLTMWERQQHGESPESFAVAAHYSPSEAR